MTLAERKIKAKKLEKLIEDFVEITFKSLSDMQTSIDDSLKITSSIAGYVVDVDECFIYLGEEPDSFCHMLDIDEIGKLSIKEDVPEELLNGDKNVH